MLKKQLALTESETMEKTAPAAQICYYLNLFP